MTLQRYIAADTITVPRLQKVGGIKMRLWSTRDIERARKQIKTK